MNTLRQYNHNNEIGALKRKLLILEQEIKNKIDFISEWLEDSKTRQINSKTNYNIGYFRGKISAQQDEKTHLTELLEIITLS